MPRRTAIVTASVRSFGTQLLHDVLHVNLHGLLGDEQMLGDVAVSIAACHVLQDVLFALGQRFVADVFGQKRRDFRRDALLPRVDLPDHRRASSWGGMLLRM